MILNFIAFAYPPLSIQLLEHAVSPSAKTRTLSPGNIIREGTISDLCSSLVRKQVGKAESHFEFAHFSVREFLDSEELVDLGLKHFRVSRSNCARLLAVQSLRYLLLDDFNRSPEATEQSINAIARDNERYKFYVHACVFWVTYARSEWANPIVAHLTSALFHPRKTPAFNNWATSFSLYLGIVEKDQDEGSDWGDWGKSEDEVSAWDDLQSYIYGWGDQHAPPIYDMAHFRPEILHRNFRPLHLASCLGLSGICSSQLQDPDSQVNLQSPLGTPLQCAIAGPRILLSHDPDGAVNRLRWLHPRRSTQAQAPELNHGIPLTVKCLLMAGAECVPSSLIPGSSNEPLSLMDAAIIAACDSKDFSVVSLLLARGATIGEEGFELFKKRLLDEMPGLDPSPLRQPLRSFLLSLNQLVKTSPSVLPLASLVWRVAMNSQSTKSFSQDFLSKLDPRIWVAESDLSKWAIHTITSTDVISLDALLSDGRFDLLSIRTENGDSLLHVATSVPGYHCDLRDRFDISIRLLKAGFSPSATNDVGKSPLHVWNWGCWVKSDEDAELMERLVRAFIEAGFDIGQSDWVGRNVLHDNLKKPRELQAIINVAGGEALDRALLVVSNIPNLLTPRETDMPEHEVLQRRREEPEMLRETNKHEGFTPLMEALTSGREEAAMILLRYWLQRRGRNPKDQQQDDGTSKLLVEMSESEESVRALVDSGMCVRWNAQCLVEPSPLHQLSWEATTHCVKLLKALYPHSCETRVKEWLPLENYLNRCLRRGSDQDRKWLLTTSTFPTVVLELATLGLPANNDNRLKAPTWEFFTTLLAQKKIPPGWFRPLSSAAVIHMVKLGYLDAYEGFTNRSGLTHMVLRLGEWRSMLPDSHTYSMSNGLWPLMSESIQHLVTSTRHWPKFNHSPAAAVLLRAASAPATSQYSI